MEVKSLVSKHAATATQVSTIGKQHGHIQGNAIGVLPAALPVPLACPGPHRTPRLRLMHRRRA